MDRFAPDSAVVCDVAPSPNHGQRKGVVAPDSVILHYTGMPTAEGALAWLRDPASQVSCHYFVFEDGRVAQLVPEDRRAWHAGRSFWAGASDLNSRSIGIEIVNPGHDGGLPDFPARQIEAVIALCADIAYRRAVVPQCFLAHSDIAPGRKRDPGEKFPWDVLARAGVGHWRTPAAIGGGRFLNRGERGQPIEALQAMLALYGYDVAVNAMFDAQTEQVVAAFQRHFRPARIDGVADASTITTLRDLIAALPDAEA